MSNAFSFAAGLSDKHAMASLENRVEFASESSPDVS